MNNIFGAQDYNLSTTSLILLIILLVWSAVWKGIALWRAGRNNQLPWYLIMLVLNTAGILEIVYLMFFAKSKSEK